MAYFETLRSRHIHTARVVIINAIPRSPRNPIQRKCPCVPYVPSRMYENGNPTFAPQSRQWEPPNRHCMSAKTIALSAITTVHERKYADEDATELILT